MNFAHFATMNLFRQFRMFQNAFAYTIQCCKYAKTDTGILSLGKRKKAGKLGPVMEKKILPVEEDAQKLVSFVCGSNINKEGEDIKIKPDSEYPEWLWKIRTGKAPPIEELDPNTLQYWRRVRKVGMRRNNSLKKLRKF